MSADVVVPVPGASTLLALRALWRAKWRLLAALLAAMVLAYGLSLTQQPMYSGRASFVVQPGERPSLAVVAQALPALAGLAGSGAAQPADLHVAILQSQAVTDRILERFGLQRVWDLRWRTQARRELMRRVSFTIGRRDGVVRLDVRDELPQRAAAIANQYVEELRAILREFSLEEARERRGFYEAQLAHAREQLAAAEQQLQASGYGAAALRAEPRAPAETWTRMQAELTAGEMRLAALRRTRADSSAEVQRQLAELGALRARLATMEKPRDEGGGEFVARLRDYRYAEALVESIARQAEGARVDEAADAVPVRWLDRAQPAEWPSSPQRLLWVLGAALAALGLQGGWVVGRERIRQWHALWRGP